MSKSMPKANQLLLCATAVAMALSPATSLAAPGSARGDTRSVRPMARVAQLPPGVQRPTTEILLSTGQGQMVTLPGNAAQVWTSNADAADVYVNNPRQIYVFGKNFGEATIYATSASGEVLYSTNVRVSQNISSVDQMLQLAMPEADLRVVMAGQLAILTGTVARLEDVEQAETIVKTYLNPGVNVSAPGAELKIGVINRLRTATPLQVNLQVKIAEVNRTLVKEIGVNLANRDMTGGMVGVLSQGRPFVNIRDFDTSALPRLDASNAFGLPPGSLSLPFDPSTGRFVTGGTTFDFANLGLGAGRTSIGLAGKLFGLDFASALDLAESEGLVTTLAQPNLTALSGETASFLAGGEFPVPISQDLGAITIQYKQFGVSLAFTPVVLDDGRISMRVRPEVSELSSQGTIRLNGFDIPALTTRRAETTVELGSGQSFMIGGLLSNSNNNAIDRAPGLGNVPVLGAMFRSTRFRRAETELVIIVTPYLVKPVSANQIALPTDGYKAATDLERVLLGKSGSGDSGGKRPVPTMGQPATVVAPSVGAAVAPPAPSQAVAAPPKDKKSKKQGPVAAPGFSGN